MEVICGILGELQRHFGIDVRVFAALYAAKVLLFWLFVFLAVKSHGKRERNLTLLWAGSAVAVGLSPYTYLLLAGRNMPLWLGFVLGICVVLSLCAVLKEIQNRLERRGRGESTC